MYRTSKINGVLVPIPLKKSKQSLTKVYFQTHFLGRLLCVPLRTHTNKSPDHSLAASISNFVYLELNFYCANSFFQVKVVHVKYFFINLLFLQVVLEISRNSSQTFIFMVLVESAETCVMF